MLFPSTVHPWALVTKSWGLQVSQGNLEAYVEVETMHLKSTLSPCLGTLDSLISIVNFKDVYHFCNWLLKADYWVNGPAWKQLSHFCRWSQSSSACLVIKCCDRLCMQSVPCFPRRTKWKYILHQILNVPCPIPQAVKWYRTILGVAKFGVPCASQLHSPVQIQYLLCFTFNIHFWTTEVSRS